MLRFQLLTSTLYWFRQHRRMINIRKVTRSEKSNKLGEPNKQQQSQNYSKQFHQQANKKEWSKQSSFHSLNYKIKNGKKLNEMFFLWRKNNKEMTIQQKLAIFRKLVILHNSQPTNIEKTEKFLHIARRIIPKTKEGGGYAPQIYTGFIHLVSKLKCKTMSYFLLHQGILPILKRELLTPTNNQQDNNANICSLISVEDNLVLLFALLKIVNSFPSILFSFRKELETYSCIFQLIKNVIEYLHVPTIPHKITSFQLYLLVCQYTKFLQLTKNKKMFSVTVVKSMIKDILKRMKTQGMLEQKKIQKLNKQKKTIFFNNLQYLFEVERFYFLLQTTYNEKLQYHQISKKWLKILQQIKFNNLQFHPFYMLQFQIRKYLLNLPIQKEQIIGDDNSQIENEEQSEVGQQLFKNQKKSSGEFMNIEIIKMLRSHYQMLFINLPIDILSKCQLLSDLEMYHNNAINYIFSLLQNVRKIKNNEKCLKEIMRFIEILLNPQILNKIPIAKYKNGKILQHQALSNLSQLPQAVLILLINHCLHPKYQISKQVQLKLIKILFDGIALSNKRFGLLFLSQYYYIYYLKHLLTNQLYLSMIEEISIDLPLIKEHHLKIVKKCIKAHFLQNQHYQERQNLTIANIQQFKEQLINEYEKQSIRNRLFSQSQIVYIQKNRHYFIGIQSNQKNNQQFFTLIYSQKSMENMIKRIHDKINLCIFMFRFMETNFKLTQQMQKINKIAADEAKLLKYNAIMTNRQKYQLEKISNLAPQSPQTQQDSPQKQQ